MAERRDIFNRYKTWSARTCAALGSYAITYLCNNYNFRLFTMWRANPGLFYLLLFYTNSVTRLCFQYLAIYSIENFPKSKLCQSE